MFVLDVGLPRGRKTVWELVFRCSKDYKMYRAYHLLTGTHTHTQV